MIVVPNADELIDAGCGVVAVGWTEGAWINWPRGWDDLVDAVCETCGGAVYMLGSPDPTDPDPRCATGLPCPDCHDGKPWEILRPDCDCYTLCDVPYGHGPVARASGFRVLPIVARPGGGCKRADDHFCVDEYEAGWAALSYVVDGFDGDPLLPVDAPPSTVVGQFALWAERIEPL